MQIQRLSFQPIIHGLIHHLPALVIQRRQIVKSLMTNPMLSDTQILVTARILVEKVVREIRHFSTVDGNEFIFVVEELDVFGAPAAVGSALG
jgi:hypothetical protein